MDIEFLFDAALTALGPPIDRFHYIRTYDREFTTVVREYNEFLHAIGVRPDEACSYVAFSKWFSAKRDAALKK